MRHVAFRVFSLGGLLSGAALIAVGINLFRNRILPLGIAIAILLYVLFDIAIFISGLSIFLSAALWSILIGALALRAISGNAQFGRLSGHSEV